MMDKISLAGDLGSGKSTVAKILIDRLHAEYYSTGAIVRAIAERMGMTVVELNKYMESHPEIDTEIDDGLRALSEDERMLIIDSRMAWHFTRGTFKVYLSTDVETSALRIMNANRKGEHNSSLEKTVEDTRARRASERKRYSKQYGVDIMDLDNYSLVVDTTYATPDQIADAIVSSFRLWQQDKSYRAVLLSAERMNYVDDAADTALVAELSSALDEMLPIPPVTVYECDGEFYVEGGLESALAYSLSDLTFVPATLCRGSVGGRKYVRMKNSL